MTTVLVAEDETIIALDICRTLAALGYSVLPAVSTGAGAIAAAERHRPDVVLMDIHLSEQMTGIEAADEIRRRWDVPVVYVTAYADTATLEQAQATEPFAYVVKPFTDRELYVAIEIAVHRHRLQRTIRESERWLSETLRNIADGVVAADGDGRIRLMNRAAEMLTGWTAAEAAGQELAAIVRITGSGDEQVLVARDGRRVPVAQQTTEVLRENGFIGGTVVAIQDVTERKRAEQEHQRFIREQAARSEAEAANRFKDEFLAMLSHELRNPLGPILNATEVLRSLGSTDEKLDRARRIIERQARHLTRLVDDLFDAARYRSGKIELRRRLVEMAEIVADAVELSRPLIDGRQQKLEVSLPDERLVLDADPMRLSQVMANLLNNAAKFSEEGGSISLGVSRNGPDVQIAVRDRGVGIPGDMLNRVFDLFAQGVEPPGGVREGLGIGLAVVRNLVGLHGGSVEARSEGFGRGSEFVVRLPLAAGAAESVPPKEPLQEGARLRILTVDDNIDATESLAMLLRILGHEIVTANDGASAIREFGAFHPDVVFLDIGLPGMDGREVARRMRAGWPERSVRIIALSGHAAPGDRSQSLAAGFDQHLVKPVDPDALVAILAACSRRSC